MDSYAHRLHLMLGNKTCIYIHMNQCNIIKSQGGVSSLVLIGYSEKHGEIAQELG